MSKLPERMAPFAACAEILEITFPSLTRRVKAGMYRATYVGRRGYLPISILEAALTARDGVPRKLTDKEIADAYARAQLKWKQKYSREHEGDRFEPPPMVLEVRHVKKSKRQEKAEEFASFAGKVGGKS
jgi:hypothetical protein